MRRITFDLDVLRSFATGVDLGSFARAAERLGRSTSAVSAQLKKLEDQAGTPIFRRAGRGLALTDAGEVMLAYARRLIDLNDEAAAAVNGIELEGWVRLGLPEDFGEVLLPDVLGRFARANPKVRIEARVGRNADIVDRLIAGKLDLALAWDDGPAKLNSRRVGEWPMRWIGPATGPWQLGDEAVVPLATFEAPCLMRTAATTALDHAGLAWRSAFISPSLGGLWAAVSAGLGLSVRTEMGLPASVRALDPGEAGLPALPSIALALCQAEAEPAPATARLATIVLETLEGARARRPEATGQSATIGTTTDTIKRGPA
ncbi:LysR substrate-binding domain-containing protein [Phreatobacter stygius]|uniref:LysR family transcriptional regulator n=1 Tax=Phreatobacter stygius TaxID=1940610 RepID=A0A4D7B2Y8_9HYPH|nr:LysR substrate-binding domain-containing protein [Phreatobacter stygius]QCI63936.1 LysR family transcriptional regulator [Phreatobacter stygius]